MPYIQRLEIIHHFKLPDFAVELPGDDDGFRHVLITGPNAAGKTTILDRLASEIAICQRADAQDAARRTDEFRVHVGWTEPDVAAAFEQGRFISAYLPAARLASFRDVDGPTDRRYKPTLATNQLASELDQYLVNEQVQARLADADKEVEAQEAHDIFVWFDRLEASLAKLFDIPGLKLEFSRRPYGMYFREPGGARYSFNQLSAGHNSILRIVGELILRLNAAEIPANPARRSGVILIDELDAHLHPAMQERILPFLIQLYPRMQFIVATHSPAIICSVDNALVVDLEHPGHPVMSSSLRGVPYGRLMTTHFGIETDVDLESTEALKRLKELRDTPSRTPAQQAELRALAESLSRTSHALALETWNRLRAEEFDEADDPMDETNS